MIINQFRTSFNFKFLIILGTIVSAFAFIFSPTTASASLMSKSVSNNSSLQNGLVGWWTFDGVDMVNNVVDKSGNGNTGYMTGFGATSSALVAGKLGQAIKMKGVVTNYIKVNDSTLLKPAFVTVSAWVNVKDDGQSTMIAGKDHSGALYAYYLRRTTTDFQFGSNYGNATFSSSGYLNKWIHIVGIFDGSYYYLYLNGALVKKSILYNSALDYTGNLPLYIGGYATSYPNISLIDDVRVYNRVLSSGEITQLYNSGQEKIGKTPSSNLALSGPDSGLLGWWTFDAQNFSDKVYDLSGRGNHGYVYGAATTSTKTTGKIGQALKTLGATGYVRTKSADFNFQINDTYSFSAWIKRKPTSSYHAILGKMNNSTLKGYTFFISDTDDWCGKDSLDFQLSTDSYLQVCGESNVIKNDVWQHVVMVNPGNFEEISMYVDGKPIVVEAFGFEGAYYTDNGVALHLGDDNNGPNSPISVDDVRVYGRALSASEVLQLYNQGSASIGKTSTSDTGLSNGLVGHWTFDGSKVTDKVYDSSGLGNNGYFIGGATSSAKVIGKIGQGLKFDGVDDFINAGVSPTGGLSAITVSAWVKREGSDSQMLLEDGTAFNTNSFYFYLNQGRPEFEICGTNYDGFTGSNVLELNKWSHYVGVWSAGQRVKVYINGLLVAGTQGGLLRSENLKLGNTNLIIGGRPIGATITLPYKGGLDDVRVYNRALSDDEIKKLYNMGR